MADFPFSNLSPIWQPTAFATREAMRYDLGPLSLIISRREEEWRFRYKMGAEALREIMRREPAGINDVIDEDEIVARVAAHDDEPVREIQLQPLLPDRFVSARPEVPVTIAPGTWAAMFVTAPLWIRVLRLPNYTPLLEIPTFRPVDTWLGPATGDGPLAYASRVFGRLNIEQLRLSPMRAIAKVTLKNSGSAPLLVPRVVIPATELRLFVDTTGRYWTNEITLTRGKDGQLSELTYLSRAPEEAGITTVVAEPRTPPGNVFARAMSSILGV